MRSGLCTILLLLFLGSSTCWAVNYDTTHNLVTNGGAEQNWLGDWGTAQNFSVSGLDSHSGIYSFEAPALGTRNLSHNVMVVNEGEKLRFGLSYKTLAGNTYLGSVAQVRFYDTNLVFLGILEQINLGPTAGIWLNHTLEMTAPAGAAYADINILIVINGVARVDDVFLYRESLVSLNRNLVHNGDAERGGFDDWSFVQSVAIDPNDSAGPGTQSFRSLAGNGALAHWHISATTGESLLVSMNYKTPVGDTTTGSAIVVRFYDSTTTWLFALPPTQFTLTPTNGIWENFSGAFKVPAGVARIDLLLIINTTDANFDDISLHRRGIAADTRTNLITNGDFEDGFLSVPPDPNFNSGLVINFNAVSSDNTTVGGMYSMEGSPSSTPFLPSEYVPLAFLGATPGEFHRVSLNYKTLPGATKADNGASVFVRYFKEINVSPFVSFLGQEQFALPLTNGQWQEFSQDFVLSSDANVFDVFVAVGKIAGFDGTVRVDDIRVYRELVPTDPNDLVGFSSEWLANAQPDLNDIWSGAVGLQGDANNLGATFNMHFISTIWNNNTLYTYYIVNKTGGKFAVGLATSTDGITFANQGMVLDVGIAGQWDDERASFPGVWKDGVTWYMVYEGARSGPGTAAIGLATSLDGINWTKEPSNPILVKSGSGFMSSEIGTPSLWKEGSTWYLFYHGFDLTDVQIGVATGTDILNLSHHSTTVPRVPTSTLASDWDSGTAGKRSIFKIGSFYYMAYEGSTDQPFVTAQWSTGLARSTDLLNWTKFPGNPVIPQTMNRMGNDGPELIRIDGVPYLYVRAASGGGTNRYKPNCLIPLQWDASGDCVVNFFDFTDFAFRWLAN